MAAHFWVSTCLLCSLVTFPYFFDSLVSSYKSQIMHRLHINHTEFGFLFSMSALTGVFAPLLSIFMYCRQKALGPAAQVAAFFIFMGACLGTWAFLVRSYMLFMLSRCICWTFTLFLSACKLSICSELSQSKMGLLYGLGIACSRFGGVAGYFFSGTLLSFFQHQTPQYDETLMSLALGSILQLLPVLGLAIFIFMNPDIGKPTQEDLQNGRSSLWEVIQNFKRMTLNLGYNFWLAAACIGCVYGTIFAFELVGVNILETDYRMSALRSGQFLALCPLGAMMAPLYLLGLSDDLLVRVKTLIMGFIILSLGLILICSDIWAVAALVLISGGYAICPPLLWTLSVVLALHNLPSHPRIQVTLLVNNLGLITLSLYIAFSHFFVGMLRDAASNYFWVEIWLLLLCIHGIVLLADLFFSLRDGTHKPDKGAPSEHADDSLDKPMIELLDGGL